MSEAYDVVPEDLVAHASHLDALTDRLNTAISAAETVSMSDDAYGLICQFLPPIINPMEEEGITALNAAVEGITTSAENVRATADQYLDTDDANQRSFKNITMDHIQPPEFAGGPGPSAGGGAPAAFQRADMPAQNVVRNDYIAAEHASRQNLGEPVRDDYPTARHTPQQVGEPVRNDY
ncbi:type VII secretion target, partial [Actinoalloteichus hoggarensis]